MTLLSDRELETRLRAVGNSLLEPPASIDELLPLLDKIEKILSKVEQSPAKSIQTALSPLMKALAVEELMKHSDVDVKVGVASCISEITRITAPDAPYEDDKMKDVFHLIVSSFENLSDTSSRSHDKRVTILETVAKVRSCVIMLDLECDQMIVEMFQHFLKAIRDYHSEVVFESMVSILTLVLEESEDIAPNLLSPILATLKKNNEAVLPIAKKLAESVIQNCAEKIRPYLVQAVRTLDDSLDEYSEILTSACQKNTGTAGQSNDDVTKDLTVDERKSANSSPVCDTVTQVAKEGKVETGAQVNDSAMDSSPNINENNGVNETVTGETAAADANSSEKADSNEQVDAKSASQIVSDSSDAQKAVKSEAKVEHSTKRKLKLPNSKKKSAESSDLLEEEKQAEQVPSQQDHSSKVENSTKRKVKLLNSKKKSAESSDLLEEEKQSEQVPSQQEHSSKDDEVPPHTAADKPLDDVTDPSIQLSPSKSPEMDTVNVTSPTQSNTVPKESQSKKSRRAKRKRKNLGSVETDNSSKKTASEGPNTSGAKKQRSSLKKTINKDTTLNEEVSSKNEGILSSSDSEARSPDQTQELGGEASNKTKAGTSSKKEEKKKSGKAKKSKSSAKDPGEDMVASPRSPLKSTKDEANLEETTRTSTKRKRTPSTNKTPETMEYAENMIGSEVKVWWPKDQMFYKGVITSFDSKKKKHMVLYTDGDTEVLNLKKERWEVVGVESALVEGQAVENSSHDPSSDVQRKKKKGNTKPETSSKGSKKTEDTPKREFKSSGKVKGTTPKPDGKAEAKSKDKDSKSNGKSIDDTAVKPTDHSLGKSSGKSKGGKPGGKFKAKSKDDSSKSELKSDVDVKQKDHSEGEDDSPKASGKSKKKTPSHSKQDAAKSKGNKTPQSSKSGTKEIPTDLAKLRETIKGKSPDTAKPRESETKSGKKRRR